MTAITNHWLVRAAAGMGMIESARVTLPAGSPTSAIWEEIERLSGIGESDLVARVAPRLRMSVADLTPDPAAIKLVPERVASRHGVLPIQQNNQRLVVATSDPMDFTAEQTLGFASSRTISFALAGPRAIERALREFYTGDDVDALVAGLDESLLDAVIAVNDDHDESINARDLESRPVVKLTNMILSDAVRDRASDIHIQPVGSVGVVRCRIDGVMRNTMQLPLSAVTRVISRIKVLAQMDIADRVRPQDGRARLRIRNAEYDLRVSTIPVSGGEKAVIRILAPATSTKIVDLGLPSHEMERLERLLRLRDGVIAVTGPTGSGKTTTLYAALRQLATGETNIVTVEDPIEYRLAGISQTQADVKRGVTFAAALRAVLRQDPDVILIGEMRDQETAGIAMQAAMTGHLVLATLHTNDAAGTIPRLADLGVERNSIADTLRGALGQRLLRRICRACAAPVGHMTEDEKRLAARYNVKPVLHARGCEECNRIGYRGRLPVIEVLIVTPQLRELIAAGASTAELQRAAVAGGMRPMLEVALDHVRSGLTTLEEVERVLGEAAAPDAVENPPLEGADAETETPTILLADDDPVIRQLARFVLNTEKYNVMEVDTGRAALDYIAAGNDVSLLVLDLDMPEMSGLDVLKKLRSDRATRALPIVVLTGTDSSEEQVMAAGADDYIRKPLAPETFLRRVKAVLRRATL